MTGHRIAKNCADLCFERDLEETYAWYQRRDAERARRDAECVRGRENEKKNLGRIS